MIMDEWIMQIGLESVPMLVLVLVLALTSTIEGRSHDNCIFISYSEDEFLSERLW
jgi:hypothetical protein